MPRRWTRPTPRPPTASTHSPAESSSRLPSLTPSPFKKPTNTIPCTASAATRAQPMPTRTAKATRAAKPALDGRKGR
eukprot:6998728-Prymnesium_polylepis.1